MLHVWIHVVMLPHQTFQADYLILCLLLSPHHMCIWFTGSKQDPYRIERYTIYYIICGTFKYTAYPGVFKVKFMLCCIVEFIRYMYIGYTSNHIKASLQDSLKSSVGKELTFVVKVSVTVYNVYRVGM